MQKVSIKRFCQARTVRLLIPLLFGMFVIVLPQVYYELKFKGYSDLTVWKFLRAYYTFDQSYDTNIPTWNHLWYIAYLWVYSMLLIPVLLYLKSSKGARLSKFLTFDWTPGWMALLAPVALLTAYSCFILPYYPVTHDLVNDWFNHAVNLTFLLLGYMLGASTLIWNWLGQYRWRLAAGAVLMIAYLLLLRSQGVFAADLPDWGRYITRTLVSLNIWLWILAILGIAFTHFNRPHKRLGYLNEAVYPFYILHQTIIIMIGYPLSQWGGFNIYFEGLTLSIGTFSLCFVLYEYVIRRFNLFRFLFGMKPLRAKVFVPSENAESKSTV